MREEALVWIHVGDGIAPAQAVVPFASPTSPAFGNVDVLAISAAFLLAKQVIRFSPRSAISCRKPAIVAQTLHYPSAASLYAKTPPLNPRL
jgi:hypothetical protein